MILTDCAYGALALECTAPLLRPTLTRDMAAELAGLVASDLSRFLPGVEELDLAIAGAGYDPSELLRPGWPVHDALAELARRAPRRAGARIMGFGSHEDKMPEKLAHDPALEGGPLRLVPFVLLGDAEALAGIGAAMEEDLIEKGMAQAATALQAQKSFNGPLEHARYLSLSDLLAMTAMQYEHAGLGPLWSLVEAALLAPDHEEWVDAPPEPLARWSGKQVHIAMMEPEVWQREGFVPPGVAPEQLPRAFEFFQMRQQQYAAVVGSHGLKVCFEFVGSDQDPRQVIGG